MINNIRYQILASGEVRNRDIVRMCGCSKAKASGILKEIKKQEIEKQEIKKQTTEKYYLIFADSVSAEAFLKYMGWNLNKIHSLAKQELELKGSLQVVS